MATATSLVPAEYALNEPHLAHAPEWAAVIQQAYGHTPLYLTGTDDAGCHGVLPAFIVRRPLAGTIVTSMPFLDGGGPCSQSPEVAADLVTRLLHAAHDAGAATVELRCNARLPMGWTPSTHKVNLVLPLPDDPDELWRRFDKSVRNQIRKAERGGLTVEAGGAERLDAFYEIFAERMHQLGSPVHARRFFRATLEAFGERARVVVVMKGSTVIGGLIALTAGHGMVVPWASSATAHRELCPNMALYWHVIRAACLGGLRSFDFGRSTRDSGTYAFKRQWGALDKPLYWYTIPLRRGARPQPASSPHASRLANLWRHLPLAVTRRLGPRVRRYLVQ